MLPGSKAPDAWASRIQKTTKYGSYIVEYIGVVGMGPCGIPGPGRDLAHSRCSIHAS